MAVYFNDLTLDKIPQQNAMLLGEFWKVMRRLSDVTAGREKRILANEDGVAGLGEAISSSCNPEQMMYFTTFFAKPFQDEESREALERAEEHLKGTEYHIAFDGQDSSVKCEMMGWAEHEFSMTMGLASSKAWIKSPVHEMIVSEIDERGELVERTIAGICVAQEEQLNEPCVLERLDDMRNLSTHGNGEICAPDQTGLPARGRIIVIGAHNIAPLKELARNVGFDDSRFEFIEYQRVSNLESDSWRNSGSISAIMCGPVPHSGGGMGDVSSFVRSLERTGFPPLQVLKKSMGKLAVTRQSFKLGLMCLMKKGAIVINKV